jgi:hypothetical protein
VTINLIFAASVLRMPTFVVCDVWPTYPLEPLQFSIPNTIPFYFFKTTYLRNKKFYDFYSDYTI